MRYSIWISWLLLLSSCAQVVAPTGGEKDILPPEVIEMNPPNESIEFDEKEITLQFDEYIQLRNLKKELIVSPPLKYNLEAKVKGKSLQLSIEDTLLENTTYVLNFGKAIVDLREGNPINNFQYVFSTGAELDSLTIRGTILNGFDLNPEEDFYLLLYPTDSYHDSTPYFDLPAYVCRTNTLGKFKLTNIKEGSYAVFALQDNNSNYLYDSPTERIAFLNEPVIINQHRDSLKLYSFLEDREKQYIKKQTATKSQLLLEFNRTLTNFSVAGIDTSLSEVLLQQFIHPNQDSVTLWFKQLDSYKLQLGVYDDTLFADSIRFKVDSLPLKDPVKLEKAIPGSLKHWQNPSITFNRPIEKIDTSLIYLLSQDSSRINYNLIQDSSKKAQFTLLFDFEEDSSYQLVLDSAAFTDLYGRSNDSMYSRFRFTRAADFGNLFIKLPYLDTTSSSFLILSQGKGKEVDRQLIKDKKASFTNLRSGEYQLKLVLDQNSDGLWTTGNYLESNQADKVILYEGIINLRPNWDKEIEWIIQP